VKIEIKRITDIEKTERGIESWPIWEKEESEFEWFYDSQEECYLLKGEVEIISEDGQSYVFGAGDFVIFPKGLKCTWKIKKAVKKHYYFL